MGKRWTKEDDDFLRSNCTHADDIDKCAIILNRTTISIKSRLSTIKIKRPSDTTWSQEELQILYDIYPSGGPLKCMELINRTKPAICAKAFKLNIKYKFCEWTKDEIHILQKEYPSGGSKKCIKLLNRSKTAINVMARKLNIKLNKSLSNIEKQFIINNYPRLGVKKCAIILNKSITTIYKYARTLGVSLKRPTLAEKYPLLGKSWDSANNHILAQDIKAHSRVSGNWLCEKCGNIWIAEVRNRTSHNSGCPYCANFNGTALCGFNDLTVTHPELIAEWDDDTKPSKYLSGSSVKVNWKCIKCAHKWKAAIANRTSSQKSGCPNCNKSKGENYITIILTKYNISFIHNHRFPECKNKLPLPFDFFLPDYNICIEFHGQQHYESVPRFGGQKKLRQQQKHDSIKRQFCKANHIRLIEIKYTEIDDLESILVKELGLPDEIPTS